MTQNSFDEIQDRLAAGGVEAVFEQLAAELREQKKYHELFDALLMQSRYRLRLPLVLTTSLDDLADPLRTQLEEAYLDSCREVGRLLLAQGRLREAWMYLRPVGEKEPIAKALTQLEPTSENLQDIIEIALHEGVAPALGYRLVLENYGTCNAISTFEAALAGRGRADQQAAAGLLVRHLHRDLLANVRADVTGREEKPPADDAKLATLIAAREWIFEDNNYHIDTSHLSAAVRLARLCDDQDVLRLALDLTEYGRRLGKQFQFEGEEPFADVYPSHGLWFAARLGQNVDEAIAYFRERAASVDVEQNGTAAIETYIALLAHLERWPEAIDAAATLLPPGVRTHGLAPSLLELSRRAESYERILSLTRERGDLIGYTAALLESRLNGSSSQ